MLTVVIIGGRRWIVINNFTVKTLSLKIGVRGNVGIQAQWKDIKSCLWSKCDSKSHWGAQMSMKEKQVYNKSESKLFYCPSEIKSKSRHMHRLNESEPHPNRKCYYTHTTDVKIKPPTSSYIYICIYMYIYVYMYVYIYMYICVYIYVYVCIYVLIYVYVLYMYIYLCVCVCVCVCVCIYIYIIGGSKILTYKFYLVQDFDGLVT